jgi:hypothetical protein
MKMDKLQLRGNNSVCAGAFQLLLGRAPAHLRGNIDHNTVRGLGYDLFVPDSFHFLIRQTFNAVYSVVLTQLTN